MMKYVFILFPVLLIAQPNSDILFLQNYQKATVLNGANQYWTKLNPVNFNTSTNINFVLFVRFKTTMTGTGLMLHLYASGKYIWLDIGGAAAGRVRSLVFDGTNLANTSSAGTYNDNIFHSVAVVANRSGNLTLYIDGSAVGTPASMGTIGSLDLTSPELYIGTRNTISAYFNGGLASIQFIKFETLPDEIAQIVAKVSAQKKPLSSYPGGQIVAWYDWQSGGTDKSGSGNHLTPVNNPIIVNAK